MTGGGATQRGLEEQDGNEVSGPQNVAHGIPVRDIPSIVSTSGVVFSAEPCHDHLWVHHR
jgi:hypothetical protein